MERKNIRTFTELADAIGITKNQLSFMLSETYCPLKARVVDLCRILSVTPNEIMISEGSENTVPIAVAENDVTAVELFAGAGGLALGLELAGIQTLEYVEFDKACCETLRANRPDWNVVCDDIHNVDFTAYKGKLTSSAEVFPVRPSPSREKSWGLTTRAAHFFTSLLDASRKSSPKCFSPKMSGDLSRTTTGGHCKPLLTFSKALDTPHSSES